MPLDQNAPKFNRMMPIRVVKGFPDMLVLAKQVLSDEMRGCAEVFEPPILPFPHDRSLIEDVNGIPMRLSYVRDEDPAKNLAFLSASWS
jgi:hypothetical protein